MGCTHPRDSRPLWKAAVVGALTFDPIAEAGRHWRRHWGSSAVPAMMAVTSVMRAQQLLLARLNEALEPYGLTFARYEALMLLFFSRRGSLPLGKMGVRLQVHPTSVTNLIDGLEKVGYVTRSPHPNDRRATLATITDTGRATAEQATLALNEIRFGLGSLEPAELDTLTGVVRSLRIDAGDFPP
jgi:DNA-binding MarR family transcriptional regulator